MKHSTDDHATRRPIPPLRFIVTLTAVLAACQFVRADEGPATETKDTETKDKDKPVPENPFPNAVPAPSLDGGKGWLNASGEITLKDLRGKVVLLDFWTYCCINCMHVLPDLKYLEKKYDKELVVIGVHSAKFDNEKESENIRNAIVRYEIEHPVINDAEMTVWRKFGARSWPTLVMIDPEGKYLGYISGEGHRELLDRLVGKVVKYHEAKGTLDRTPVRFDLEREKLPPTPLKYPGKVLADPEHNRLFISDSNHNRIVIATLAGELLDVVGTGKIGSADGPYNQAQFDHPQGMERVGETLYVADTENHLLRAVDLKAKTVSTLAGTGEQARIRSSGGPLRETALNSPWDLEHLDGVLYIAMAGPHQIWSHELGSKTIGVFAGTGREDVTNGPLGQSNYAQPSSISSDGKVLFVADSEGSSIRRLTLGEDARAETIAGESDLPGGRTLFEFGDRDGVGAEARLQHPLGTAYANATLYVADSYNHKLKTIDLKTNKVTTWLGTGEPGTKLDPPQFSEPSGLTVAGGKLYIADTNNHRILTADLKTAKVAVLEIAGLKPPKAESSSDFVAAAGDVAAANTQRIKPGKSVRIRVNVELPEGMKLNKDAPAKFKLTPVGKSALFPADRLKNRIAGRIDGETVTVDVPLAAKEGKGTYEVSLSYVYCRDGKGGLCKLETTRWKLPLTLSSDGADVVELASSAK